MKIFLSYSTPIRLDQEHVLEVVKSLITSLGIEIKTVSNCSLGRNPIFSIIDTMNTCDNCISLAFMKYKTTYNDHICYHTSPWIDIEVALALQRKMPCLVLRENGLVDTPLASLQMPACRIIEMAADEKVVHGIDFQAFRSHTIIQLNDWIKSQFC